MKKTLSLLITLTLLLGCFAQAFTASASADTASLYHIYADNMLFGQNRAVKIGGTGTPGAQIKMTVKDGDIVVTTGETAVGMDGTFCVSAPGVAGGYTKYTVTLSVDGTVFATLNNVVFGELWLANGQSNMAWALALTRDGHETLQKGLTDQYIRFMQMDSSCPTDDGTYPRTPQADNNSAKWITGTDAAMGSVSAVAYFFAAALREKLDVPVGILNVAIGGSSIYNWIPADGIDGNLAMKAYLMLTERYYGASVWKIMSADENWNSMSVSYNTKVAPLTQMAVAGMIWYQGESNVGDMAGTYSDALAFLQKTYSEKFGFSGGTMPMIYAHIAPYDYGTPDDWAVFSEELGKAADKNPGSIAQVPIYDTPMDYDYSEFTDSTGATPLHPCVKSPVGTRMAEAAMGLVYETGREYTAPQMSKAWVEDQYVYVTFKHTGDGLAAKAPVSKRFTGKDSEAELLGFAVCGANGVYVGAKAELVSTDTVRVWNDSVKSPVAATYAFTQMCAQSNLFSTINGKYFLPAVPFRTAKICCAAYYRPNNWTSCDISESFRYDNPDDSSAHYYDSWESAGKNAGGVSLSYSTDEKYSGTSALRVDFSGSGDGSSFTVRPVMGYQSSEGKRPFDDADTD